MDASWQPDPTGRHQYRWWDGAGWTDSVADDGETKVDPMGSGPTAPAAPATVIASGPVAGVDPSGPTAVPGPPSAGSSGPVFTPAPSPAAAGPAALPQYEAVTPKSKGGKGKWIALGVVAVAALGAGAFLLFGGSDGGGNTGSFDADISDESPVVTRELKLDKGDALAISVDPQSGLDTRSALLLAPGSPGTDTDEIDATECAAPQPATAGELFGDDLDSKYEDYVVVPFDRDGGSGRADSTVVRAGADNTYVLVFAAADGKGTGAVEYTIEAAGADDSDSGSGTAAATQVAGRFECELTDDVRLVKRSIPLKKGEIYRIRVEPSGDMDTRAALILSDADADKEADVAVELFTDFYDSDEQNSYLTDAFSDSDELFSDGLEGDLASGKGSILDNDEGRGRADSGGVIGFADVTYTLVIGAYDEDSNGKIVVIIEKYEPGFEDFDDLTDAVSDDTDFFSDTEFFSDTDPYTGP